ncbi:tyrosine-type recombinase/integrase [Glacieibacterium megasporae]|uniref:tyrosine-type recombinase/integrase n=1 Tax=Glacieibacterium megasporae TaxID=2835787 RepID=UPI001C1DF13B|nr:tyrosine-type recombinase/integrase [Polymorphobacter megasporae]UAJ10043.1 hypothetical protein KTC28_17490 [Polymorphobacter megasporae]
MPADKGGVYQRGGYWLDLDRGAGGKPNSRNWYIFWYDSSTGHQRRTSTRTSDVRLACSKLDEHYLAVHKPTVADQDHYAVPSALADYWQEHGSKQASSEAIKARLKLLTRFLDVQVHTGRLVDPILPDDIDESVLGRFRSWAQIDPIVARKKDDDGNWIDGASRTRSASTAEESIIALKAALNHAVGKRRIRYAPALKHKTRDQVTPARSYRLSVEGIGELLDFTMRGSGKSAGHPARLMPLRRYLIGAICTLGRPDAILDMSVSPKRGQWMQDAHCFALNPEGRLQTNKVRPVIPVVGALEAWLTASDEWLVCRETSSSDEDQQIEVVEQIRVASVRSAWDSAREALGIPDGWGPKLIRHSMSTILATRRVDLVELEMALGHRVLGKTSSRYVIFDPRYLGTIRSGLEDVVGDLAKRSGNALHPKLTRDHINVVPMRA